MISDCGCCTRISQKKLPRVADAGHGISALTVGGIVPCELFRSCKHSHFMVQYPQTINTLWERIMRKTRFNQGWTVKSGLERPFDAIFAPSKEGRPVTLPHDAMIEEERDPDSISGTQYGFYPAKCYTYLKTFFAPAEWEQETIILEFEGVMRQAMVYLNGHFIAGNPHGYTGFHACRRTEPGVHYR